MAVAFGRKATVDLENLSLLPSLWDRTVWLPAGPGPSGLETVAPSDPCSPPVHWTLNSRLRQGNRSHIWKSQSQSGGFSEERVVMHLSDIQYCWVNLPTSHLKFFSVPAGSSARLRVMIWRMREETGTGVALDSCPSSWSVRLLSPELPSDWRRDSSSFYNYTNRQHFTLGIILWKKYYFNLTLYSNYLYFNIFSFYLIYKGFVTA